MEYHYQPDGVSETPMSTMSETIKYNYRLTDDNVSKNTIMIYGRQRPTIFSWLTVPALQKK